MQKRPNRSPVNFGAPEVPRFTCVTPKVRYQRDRERRGSASDRGYDSDWSRLRGWHLKAEPTCRECYFRGRLNKAEIVNHIIPVRLRPDLRLAKDNLSSVCKAHHDTVIRDLEAIAEQMDEIELLRSWLEDPSTRPHGHAFEAKGFPRYLRDRRAKRENGASTSF
jgi:5-methylcytosine-specific restriction endonuclease McrA